MRRRISIGAALVVTLASAVVALVLAVAPLGFVSLAGADEYGYTVRVFPGNRGELSSDPVSVTVPKGGSVDLYAIATATITDDKYVQTGFRVSGSDTLLGNGIVNGISEDIDYVVAYGVKANTVPYTLKFVEYQTGKELAEPKTYYGKPGDKPVAAYEYIEGYRPLYLAITGTLSADEENVWTFEYVADEGQTEPVVNETTTTETTTTEVPGQTTTNVTEVPGQTNTTYTETPGTNTETTTTVPGNTTTRVTEVPGTTTSTGITLNPSTATQTTAGTTGGTAGGAAAEAGGAAAGGAAGEAGGATGGETAAPQTQEILDLDTPLAGPDGKSNQAGLTAGAVLLNQAPIVGLTIALVAAIGLILFFIFKRKKDKENDEAEEQ